MFKCRRGEQNDERGSIRHRSAVGLQHVFVRFIILTALAHQSLFLDKRRYHYHSSHTHTRTHMSIHSERLQLSEREIGVLAAVQIEKMRQGKYSSQDR